MSDQDTVHPDYRENSVASKTGTNAPRYEVPDKKPGKESSSHYSMLSTSNLNKENIYAGASSKGPTTSKERKNAIDLKRMACILAMSVCALAVVACFVAIFTEIAQLKTEKSQSRALVQQAVNNLLQQTNETFNQLNHSVNSLIHQQWQTTQDLGQALDNHIQQLNNSIETVKLDQDMSDNTIQALLAQIRQDEIGRLQALPVSSCATLKALSPSSPSGYYWVRASNGSAVRVYCDMTRSCGGVTGGWMRVAELDMTNSSHQCPSQLQQNTTTNGRTCRIESVNAMCSPAITYSTILEYSKVCGKIRGFKTGQVDNFAGSGRGSNTPLRGNYVDGVSLTYGHLNHHLLQLAVALVLSPVPVTMKFQRALIHHHTLGMTISVIQTIVKVVELLCGK